MADIFTFDGYSYLKTGQNTISVTGYEGTGTELYIPELIIYDDMVYFITEIGDNFSITNKNDITTIHISDNITIIGDNAFDGCSALKNVIIGSKVIDIGVTIFNNCPLLEKIIFMNNTKNITSYDSNSTLDIFGSIPNTTELILCKTTDVNDANTILITKFTAKSTSTIIYYSRESNVFIYNNSSIITINIMVDVFGFEKLNLIWVSLGTNVIELVDSIFSNCAQLISLHLPNTILNIKGSVFKNCIKLKALIIPKSVIEIGNGIVDECSELVYIDIAGHIITNTYKYPIVVFHRIVNNTNELEITGETDAVLSTIDNRLNVDAIKNGLII